MYLARAGLDYDMVYNWPAWKVITRLRHNSYWVEREEKETEAAIAASERRR